MSEALESFSPSSKKLSTKFASLTKIWISYRNCTDSGYESRLKNHIWYHNNAEQWTGRNVSKLGRYP